MHVYTTGQWVLLFFFYCFCGWVWESCYVSLCQRRWVNRGFLHGPLLPIYGSGAIIILFVTLPVEDSLVLIWLLGMLAATALEYVVGAAMEKIFQVRYWDYSQHRFNLNGHICLSSSIAWGFFSILLVRFLHPPVGRLLGDIPSWCVDPLALVLTVAFTVDVVRSVQAALDLREILTRLTEENEELRRLAKRVEVASAFAEDDLRRFREKTEVEKLLLQERLEAERRQRQEAQARRKLRRREALEEALRRRTAAKLKALRNIAQALEAYQARMEGELTGAALERRRAEVNEALEKLRDREAAVRARTERTYRQALRILRGNPTARSTGRLAEALESLRKLTDPREDENS